MMRKTCVAVLGVLCLVGTWGLLVQGETKYPLIITDGGNWCLPWIHSLSVFPYDPTADPVAARGKEPVVTLYSLSDPVRIMLPPGDYEVVIVVLVWYSNELKELSLGRIKLEGEYVIDLRRVNLPFEKFVPW